MLTKLKCAMQKMLDYSNKTVVVTGGSGGIGNAVCEELATLGAKVVLVYSRKDISGLKSAFEAKGLNLEYLQMDVSDKQSVGAGAAWVAEKLGGADVLITAAGVALTEAALEYSAESWRKTQGINLDGTFYCAQAFAPQMQKKGKGAISAPLRG